VVVVRYGVTTYEGSSSQEAGRKQKSLGHRESYQQALVTAKLPSQVNCRLELFENSTDISLTVVPHGIGLPLASTQLHSGAVQLK